MARPLRIEFPGAYYHIVSRGNEQRKIFNGSKDREQFLLYIGAAHDRFSAVIHCYCLMDNHYHLFIQTPLGNLSRIMHYINASYTAYFNRIHRRFGHLFQGRFNGILVEPSSYAMELSRYIHLNPVRANIVKKAEDYRWSSYRFYLGVSDKPEWLDTDLILSYFGKVKFQRIQQYRNFIQEAIGKKYENPLNKAVGSVLLGSELFVNEIKEKYINDAEVSRDLPSIRSLKRKSSVEEIVKTIEKESGIKDNGLLKKVAIHISHRYSDMYLKNMGDYFGVSESAVSQMSARFEREIEQDENLELLVEDVKRKLFS
jgi:putative transposase